ncbi:MAG: hypothetical protein H6807_02765 [Planctomycetes bacterium]|nr:hypothetical protein [Planctomycetota bacterium]
MPRSSLTELLFALAFALVTTFVAGSLITTDAVESAQARKDRVEQLVEERSAIQIQAIKNWIEADPEGDRKGEVKDYVQARYGFSLRELKERRNFEKVDKIYHHFLERMRS